MPQIQQAKNLLNQFRTMQNGPAALNNYLMNNTQLGSIMNFVQNEHHGDAKEAFYAYAQQNGINPDEFINLLNAR